MAQLIYAVARADSPRRDIDLFGPTTVRIDAKRTPEGAGVPILYLSAYVDDPDRLTQRLIAALSWLDDGPTEPSAVLATAPVVTAVPVAPYAMPEFVEDVDYDERLLVAEDPNQTDWKAWASAMERRVTLAATAGQLAALEGANTVGMTLCPWNHRTGILKALRDAYEVTHDQAAAA